MRPINAELELVVKGDVVEPGFDVHLAMLPISRILAAAGALWLTLWIVQRIGAPWQVLIPLALAVYPAWLLAFRVVRPSTLKMSLGYAVAEVVETDSVTMLGTEV